MADECQYEGELQPKSLTLTAICNECLRKLRMVTDDEPAMEVEDFLDGERFRWEHD